MYSVSAVSDDDSKGSASEEDQGDNSHVLTAIPNVGYAFDHWEMTTAAEPDDSDWSIASELNETVKNVYKSSAPYVKSTATVTVTADTQFRAHFRPSQMILQDGYITSCSSLPEGTLYPEEAESFIRAWAPGLSYAPSKKSVSVGSPARLYINWWADAPIADNTNITISLYTGSEAQGDPLYSVTKPLCEASSAGVICGNPAEKNLGYVFNLYFTMPDTEAMTVSIQLEGRDPIVQTYSTGITKELARLRAEYNTLENLRYRYLIDKALDSAAVEIANTTDATEIADIISRTKSQIQAYINGTDTSYIEVSFDNTIVYVPENIQQTYAFCAALEQVYPREKGFWYLDYSATQFGVWLNGYGGRLFTESELGPDGIAHTDDDGPLETDITTYNKTWAAGEALPTSGMVSGKQYGGLQYNVNGFYADFGMSGWLVSEDEQFTWGPDDTAGYDPLYTVPHASGTADGEKQLKWATMVLHREGVTLADITEKLGDVSGKTADEVYPLLREAFSDKPYADRLVWNLPSNYTENSYVKDAYAKCSALTDESDTAEVEAAQAAYDAIPNTDFGSKIWRTHYFVNFEPYKTAYENLKSHDTTPVVTTDPDVALAGVLNYLKANVTSPAVGSVNGEWAVLAMARGGVMTDEAKAAYLANLDAALADGTAISKYTDYERVTLALSALGTDASKYGASSANLTAAYQAYVSPDKRSSENQALMADIFALIALNSKPYSGDQSSYVDALCSAALTDGGWNFTDDAASADVDTTAMAIQALAPYYSTNSSVKEKVDAALAWLKTKQDSASGAFMGFDGTVSTCSTAQVVTALCAIGQDPTGAEWTVGSTNPVLGLTVYYIADTGAFGESSTSTASQMSTEQAAYALVAYNRFKSKQNTLYDMSDAFSESGDVKDPKQTVASAKLEIAAKGSQTISMTVANTPEEVKAYVETLLKLISVKGPEYSVEVLSGENGFTAAVAGTEESPYGTGGRFMTRVTITMGDASDSIIVQGKITTIPWEAPKEDITVSFQLLGDTHHEIKTDADIHTYHFNADDMPVWIDTVEVTVPGGSTVGDVFKKVMDEKGYTYVGLERGYISSISQPDGGISLKEKDDSRTNAGWMYLVNGKHANVGLNSYTLSGGEVITWHWCDDYTIEEGSEKWSGSRVKEYIENLIKLIGEVDASDACKARIDKARAAYDKLTEAEQAKVSNYQTLQDAEAKYKSLTGMDALVSLIEEQTWTVSMNDANDAAAVKAWLEAKLNTLELNGAKVTATVTDLTAATAGTAENKNGTDGSFTFDVTLMVGEGGAQASRSLTGLTGTITATKLISSDAGVASVSVGGKAGKVDGTTITVVLDYADDAVIPSDADSVSIVTVDPDAQVSDLATSDEGVTWTFTVTAQDGTKVEYTIHVSIAENPAAGNIAAVAAAKSMLENASFTYASKDVNSEAAAKAAVEDQIKSLLQNTDVSFDVTMTGFTAAQDGTAENESGVNGSFGFTVKLTKGEAETSAEDSVSLTGTITAAAYVKSTNAGVSELTVAGETATISGNSFTVTVPYGKKITAESFKITLADSKASITTLPHEENGVWSFTVTAEDGSTTATYTVTVTIGKNPEQDSNQKDVDDAKATISGKTFDVKQKDINSEAALKQYIEKLLKDMGLGDVKAEVEITSFNAAVAGDSQNKDGVNGSFTATVKLTKGSGDALAESTVAISGTIFATAYSSGGNTGKPSNPGSKPSTGSDAKKDDGKTVKSGNTGDAGITLYLGMGLVAVLAGAVVVTRKRKEN